MIFEERWFLHLCHDEAVFRCQGYLDKIQTRINPTGFFLEIGIRGFDRADIDWMESAVVPMDKKPIDAIRCIRSLSAKLIEKVRRFEEDRELNLTP